MSYRMCSVLRYLTDMTDSHFPLGQKLCVAMFTSLYPCNYFVANVGVVYSFLLCINACLA